MVREATGMGTVRAATGVGPINLELFLTQTLELDAEQTIYTKALHRPDQING
jgi:hypothetical protein